MKIPADYILLLHVSKHYNDPTNHELTEETMMAAIRIMRWFAGRELSCLEDVTNYDPTIMECKGRVFTIERMWSIHSRVKGPPEIRWIKKVSTILDPQLG